MDAGTKACGRIPGVILTHTQLLSRRSYGFLEPPPVMWWFHGLTTGIRHAWMQMDGEGRAVGRLRRCRQEPVLETPNMGPSREATENRPRTSKWKYRKAAKQHKLSYDRTILLLSGCGFCLSAIPNSGRFGKRY